MTESELLGWLRQVLLNHLLAAQRRYINTEKRTARREFSLNGYLRLVARSHSVSSSSSSTA